MNCIICYVNVILYTERPNVELTEEDIRNGFFLSFKNSKFKYTFTKSSHPDIYIFNNGIDKNDIKMTNKYIKYFVILKIKLI